MKEQVERRKAETGKGQSNLPLGVLVELDTLVMAGFNYAEVSFRVPTDDGKLYLAHVSDQGEGGRHPNIVIIEDIRQRGAVRWREWYFGTFEGTSMAERHGENEKDDYFDQIKRIIHPDNKVSGFSLQWRIEKEIDKMFGGAE